MPLSLVLNPEQQKSVEHAEGPLLVIAGPGSGKTRVITQRIVHLLTSGQGFRPQNILALTFTDKAAEEMRRRVQEALPDLNPLPQISTFHAFCLRVLCRRHFERRLLDKTDVWIFLRRRMKQLQLRFYQKLAEPGAFLHDLNEFFSRCQDELIEPVDFENYVQEVERSFIARYGEVALGSSPAVAAPAGATPEWKLEQEEILKRKELARVFRRSRELIEQAGCSSFGSLISETLRLWDREPELLEHDRARFRYLLVDEFQDTNFAQWELLRRLAALPYNITAVGDDDQAIYRFRGASHGAFKMFDEIFPGHETVYLHHNYRSTKKILRAADTLISHNDRYEAKKPLRTANPEGPAVYLLESSDYQSEAAWVAAEVERLSTRGTKLGDVAVLYRGHHYRDLLVEEFRRRRVPFNIRGLSILSATIIRDLVAYLKIIASPHENISLTRVLLASGWRFPEELALEIRRRGARERCSIYSALRATDRTLFAAELRSTGWPELESLLGEMRQVAESAPVTALFDQLVARLDLVFLPGDRDQEYVTAFRRFMAKWEEKGKALIPDESDCEPKAPLTRFLEYFGYFVEAGGAIELPEPENTTNAVQMMTVHAAKGLEFPVVFVLSVARQRFPHREERPVIGFPDELRKGPCPPPDIHLQEERRLFYVAMTRARERLYVSGVTTGRKASVFIHDLLSNPVVAARDIERVQVPPAGSVTQQADTGGEAPRQRPAYVPSSERPENQGSQWGLFEQIPRPAAAVHPDIAGWASRTPVDGMQFATASREAILGSTNPKLRLSASMVETYRDCPLKFKFSYCYRIPTAPQATLTFGSLMHQCVRYYFELRKRGLPKFEELRNFYFRAWKNLGFDDDYQQQIYRNAGLDQLREFVERQNGAPMDVEQSEFERSFSLELEDVLLTGRIDHINPLTPTPSKVAAGWQKAVDSTKGSFRTLFGGPPDPQGTPLQAVDERPVELIDYKTGKPRSQKDADKSLQLSVYALAARRELKMEPKRLTFYNLTSNEPVATVRTGKDLEKAIREIHDVAAQIRQNRFDPKPGYVCRRCDFVPLCPAHEEQ